MDIFNRLREKINERKALWTEEQCQDRVSAEKHINTWNVALAIVDFVEKEYCEYIEEYTGKGTFTAREVRLLELKAFEKQVIAKKPIHNGHGVFFCPNGCGSVWQIPSESKHCFRCGQKLDWSDEDEC